MRGNTGGRFANKSLNVAQAKAQMMQELCSCTDARLAQLTVDTLVARFRVARKDAEYALVIQRQRRERTKGESECPTS